MSEYNYMELAIKYAKKGALLGEIPIGAVLIDENNQKIYSTRHNEIVTQNNPLKHAEILAIDETCKVKNTRYLVDMVMYVTLEPCVMCAAAISYARIKKIYFGAYDEKNGAIEHGLRFFSKKNSFVPEVYGGIKEQECSKLLNEFFYNRRKLI